MHCRFTRHSPAHVRCTRCGHTAAFAGTADRLIARCGQHAALPAAAASTDSDFPCRHRGEALRTITCQACSRRGQQVAVHRCALHGECTLRRTRAGGPALATCLTCPNRAPPAPQPLILRCRLSPGDVVALTAAVESLHRLYPGRYLTDVRTPAPDVWRHNPHITPLADRDARTLDMHYPLIQQSHTLPVHFLAGYARFLGAALELPLDLVTNRPHLYLSPAEAAAGPAEVCPALADGRPYWLISAGVKRDFTAKQWPVEHYQTVVDRTRDQIRWVQIGAAEHDHPPLSGVLDWRGRTSLRQLIRLAAGAAGGLGPVTLLMHLCAAFEKPYVCLLGGREPVSWVQYPRQVTLHTIGQLACCPTACWKSRVAPLGDGSPHDLSLCERPVSGLLRPVAECQQRITPEEAIAAVLRAAW